MNREILYTLPADADAKTHQILKLTVGEASALAMARYKRFLAEAREFLLDKFGEVDEDAEPDPERNEWVEVIFPRAYMLACLVKVEQGECAADAEQPETWKPAKLPAEWLSVEGFATIPGKLFSAWEGSVTECNPNLFYVSLSNPNARRPGSVIVNTL